MQDEKIPIKLRGHHIELLERYHRIYKNSSPNPKDFHSHYGTEYIEKYIDLCKKVMNGENRITIIDSRDDFCLSCGCRENDGCLHENFFEHEMSIAQADNVIAKKYGMEIGRTYDGLEFLKVLGVTSND